MSTAVRPPRRGFLLAAGGTLALGGAALAQAPALTPTPAQTEGPFYPVELPADADNDLVRVGTRDARAAGTVLYVTGQVLDVSGRPAAGVRVEIWQTDAAGIYLHPGDRGFARRDANFQGFGAATSDAEGRYRFRTIRPARYPGRTPHIHFKVGGRAYRTLVTQMYFEGEPGNASDGLLNWMRPEDRGRLIVPARPVGDTEPGAQAARFDIVLARA